MAIRKRSYDEEGVKYALLDHAFRAALHRLRGVQSLLAGWAEIGTVGDETRRVRIHQEEATALLARIEWLHGARVLEVPMKRLAGGASPQVLLSAAACNATPEEADGGLPEIAEPEAGLALALWLEAQRPEGEQLEVRFAWRGNTLELSCTNGVKIDLEEWQRNWKRHVVESGDGRVVFRAGCFRRLEPVGGELFQGG